MTWKYLTVGGDFTIDKGYDKISGPSILTWFGSTKQLLGTYKRYLDLGGLLKFPMNSSKSMDTSITMYFNMGGLGTLQVTLHPTLLQSGSINSPMGVLQVPIHSTLQRVCINPRVS